MKEKTQLLEPEKEHTEEVQDIQDTLEQDKDENTELEETGNLLEPEENVFSRRLPTFDIAKGGYFLAKPEDYFLKGEKEPTDNAFHRNFGLEIGAGAAIGAIGAHAFDPTGLYTQALSDPDPINIAIAGTAGLVGNSLYGAGVGAVGGGVQNVARTMLGATLAASGATYSFMTNNAIRGLEQGEKYLRNSQESELANTATEALDRLSAEAEAIYDRLTGKDSIETYSPDNLEELEERFSELDSYGKIDEFETSFQALADKSEISEVINYLQTDDEISVRTEDIQVEERQKGRLTTYHGKVDFAHEVEGEPYRNEDYALEFEAVVNKSEMEKINF